MKAPGKIFYRKKPSLILVVFSCLMILSGTLAYDGRPAAAAVVNDPLKLAIGARAIGLGRSFLAGTDDVNSLFINPAGLASMGNFQASVMAGNLANDYSYASIGLGLPTPLTNIAIGFAKSEAGGIIKTTYANGRVIPDPSGDIFGASDNVFLVGAGNKFKLGGWEIQAGGRFKVYQQFLAEYSRLGFGADVGLSAKIFNDLELAVLLQNALPPRLKWAHLETVETIYPVLSLGAAYRLWQNKVTLSAQIDQTLPKGPLQTHLGAEWWLSPDLSIRVGSDDNFGNLTLGIGLWAGGAAGHTYPAKEDWEFDYAYQRLPVDLFPSGGHFFSLLYLGQSGLAKLPPGSTPSYPPPSAEPTMTPAAPPAQPEKPAPGFYQQSLPEIPSQGSGGSSFYNEYTEPSISPRQAPDKSGQVGAASLAPAQPAGTVGNETSLKVTTSPAQQLNK